MEFKTKEWSNSKTVKGSIVKIRKGVLKETFGSLKKWRIDTQKLKNELRKEWE